MCESFHMYPYVEQKRVFTILVVSLLTHLYFLWFSWRTGQLESEFKKVILGLYFWQVIFEIEFTKNWDFQFAMQTLHTEKYTVCTLTWIEPIGKSPIISFLEDVLEGMSLWSPYLCWCIRMYFSILFLLFRRPDTGLLRPVLPKGFPKGGSDMARFSMKWLDWSNSFVFPLNLCLVQNFIS